METAPSVCRVSSLMVTAHSPDSFSSILQLLTMP